MSLGNVYLDAVTFDGVLSSHDSKMNGDIPKCRWKCKIAATREIGKWRSRQLHEHLEDPVSN